MDCRDIEPLLLADRDGVLTTNQHATLNRHLSGCHSCQQLKADLAKAMDVFRADAAKISIPDINDEWQKLRSRLPERDVLLERNPKRVFVPAVWWSAPLAAAAALALVYFGIQSDSKHPEDSATSNSAIAQVEYVEPGNAEASTMIYVDKESGWLVVWTTDVDSATRS